MRLARVNYSLFERELDDFRDFFGKNRHGLDREVCLLFNGGVKKYVSWVQHAHDQSRVDSDFHLEIADKPFWTDDCLIIDMSGDAMWSSLINKDVSLGWYGPQNSVLVASAKGARVYLDVCGDFVRISQEQPKYLEHLNDKL